MDLEFHDCIAMVPGVWCKKRRDSNSGTAIEHDWRSILEGALANVQRTQDLQKWIGGLRSLIGLACS